MPESKKNFLRRKRNLRPLKSHNFSQALSALAKATKDVGKLPGDSYAAARILARLRDRNEEKND